MFAIVVNEKGGEQKRLEFDKPEVTIGRVQGNDIILPKGNVSKRHSRIVLKDGKFIIVDLKSTNGTYVNGRKITSPLVVKGSDKIYIGDFILSIEEGAAAAGAGAAAGLDDEPAAPPRRPASTVPPPPPRRAEPAEDDDEMGSSGEESDAEPARPSRGTVPAVAQPAPLPPVNEMAPPEPPRIARPSSPAVPQQPAPPSMRPPTRPSAPSRPDLPAQSSRPTLQPTPPPSRPASVAEPVAAPPRPAPPPAAPAPPAPRTTMPAMGAVSAPGATGPTGAMGGAPTARPAPSPPPQPQPARRAPAEVGDRTRLVEIMRELAARLQNALGLAGRGPEATSEEDVWSRAESAATELLDEIVGAAGLPANADAQSIVRDVVAETLGMGLFDDLLADESVREVIVARHDRVYVDSGGQRQLSGRLFSSPDAALRALERLLARAGRLADLETARREGTFLEARLDDHVVLAAALPPVAPRGPAISLRRVARAGGQAGSVAGLVAAGALSQGMADLLDVALQRRRNILVSGPAAARASVLAALGRQAALAGERVVAIDDGEELDPGDAPGGWTTLAGGAHAIEALWSALRLRPERLIIGEVRGREALDMVTALAAGVDGVLCGVVAHSPREAVARVEALARLHPSAPSHEALRDELGRAVHVIVQVAGAEGGARVVEITEVAGGKLQPIFRGDGGRFQPTGHVPAWAEGAAPSTFRP
jgi:pilus assembly protein CpaF